MAPTTPFPFVFVGDGIADEDAAEWLRQVRLYGLGHSEDDKIRVFELCIAPGSPAWDWYDNLDSRARNSFKAIIHEFKKEYAAFFLPFLPLPAWLPLERLEQCVIREEELGRDVVEERTGLILPSHIAYARRIRRLSAAVYDQPAAPLVAEARRRLPPALRACVSKQVKTWDGYVDAILDVSTSEIHKAQQGLDPHDRTWAAPNGVRHSPTQLANMASYSQSNPNNYGRQSPTNDQPPAPHVIFHSQNEPINGNPSNVPVYVTSPTENAFPRSATHSPLRANGHPPSRGATYAGTTPYSRETPSAPPSMHPAARSWLQTNTQRSPTGANGVSSGNGW